MKTPFPHQVVGAGYLSGKRVAYLAWGPRCGKTLTAVKGALDSGFARVLVLCPKGVIPVWGEEMRDWGFDIGEFHGTEKQKKASIQKPNLIINYESIWRRGIDVKEYDLVIFDESHKLGNTSSKQSRFFYNNPPHRAWLLSGTPMIESPKQMAGQMFAAKGSFFGYVSPTNYEWENWKWNEYSFKFTPRDNNHPIAIEKGFKKFASKHEAEELGLPPKLYETVKVTPSKKDLAAIKANTIKPPEFRPLSNEENRTNAMRTQQCVGGWDNANKTWHPSAKFLELKELVKELEDAKEKVLIVCRYIEEVKSISRELGCPNIYGETEVEQREKVRKALEGDRVGVIVCQIDTIKLGLDFSAASTQIFYSNSWSGEARTQCEDRTRNIAKKQPSRIIDLCSGEGDLGIAKAVTGKRDFNTRLISAGA